MFHELLNKTKKKSSSNPRYPESRVDSLKPFNGPQTISITSDSLPKHTSFTQIPQELHLEISHYLSSKDIVSVSRICNSLRNIYYRLSFRDIFIISKEFQQGEKLQIDPRYRVVPIKVLTSPYQFVGFFPEFVIHAVLDAVSTTQFEFIKDLATIFNPSVYPRLKKLDVTLKSVSHIAMVNPFTNTISRNYYNPISSSDTLTPPVVENFNLTIGVMGFFYLSELKHRFNASVTHINIVDELTSNYADLSLFKNGISFSEVFTNLVTFNFEPSEIFTYSVHADVMKEVCKFPRLRHLTAKHFWGGSQHTYRAAEFAPKTLESFKLLIYHGTSDSPILGSSVISEFIANLSEVTYFRITGIDNNYTDWEKLEYMLKRMRFSDKLRGIAISGKSRVQEAFKLITELIPDTTKIEEVRLDENGCFHKGLYGFYSGLGVSSELFVPDSYRFISAPITTKSMFSNVKTLFINISLCFNLPREMEFEKDWRIYKWRSAKDINEQISPFIRYIISHAEVLEKFVSQSDWRDKSHSEKDLDLVDFLNKDFSVSIYNDIKKRTQKQKLNHISETSFADSYSKEMTFFLFFMSALPSTTVFNKMVQDIVENPTNRFGFKKRNLSFTQKHMLYNRIDVYNGYYYAELLLDAIMYRTGMVNNLESLTIFGAVDLLSSPRFYKLVMDHKNNLRQVAFCEGITTDKEKNISSTAANNSTYGLELTESLDIYKDYLKQISLPKLDNSEVCKISQVQMLDVEAMRKNYILCKSKLDAEPFFTDRKKKLEYYDILTLPEVDPVADNIICPNSFNSHERYHWC